jgi:hypothetical protein
MDKSREDESRPRRKTRLLGLTAFGIPGVVLAISLGAAGSHAESTGPAAAGGSAPLVLNGVPEGALGAAGVRAVAATLPPVGLMPELAARDIAKKLSGAGQVRDAALVDCSVPAGPAEIRTARPCWAVSVSAEDVVSFGPIDAPRVKGSYRVLLLDAKTGDFMVGVEGG